MRRPISWRSAWLRELGSHDIGLHRSEIASAVAELIGAEPESRRRPGRDTPARLPATR